MLKIISWNVNGVRACLKKGLLEFISKEKPDILGLQETRTGPQQIEQEYSGILQPEGYNKTIWNESERKGYSGTALISRLQPENIVFSFSSNNNDNGPDNDGRIIIARYTGSTPFTLMNIYYPNGQKDDERLRYKLKFYDDFLLFADKLIESGENLVIMGDFNTAHKGIDLKNPKENENRSGFLPVEREWMDKFVDHGYIDTFRFLKPASIEYSWWTYRFNARNKNIGWRIDYVFVSKALMPYVKESFILRDVYGSDHCPVGILLDV